MLFDRMFRQDFLNCTCVPLFFCISGYLFFNNINASFGKEIYYKKIQSRIRTLAVPYLIANMVMILAVIAVGLLHKQTPDLYSAISSFWSYNGSGMPIDGPTWYLRDLMIVCLASPMIFYCIKYTRALLPSVFLVCWFLNIWPISVPGFGIRSFLFFTIGAFFALHNVDVIKRLNTSKYWWLYLIAFVVLFVSYQLLKYDWLLKLSIMASFPVWISLAEVISTIVARPCPKVLVTGTFFVFLYHFSLAHRVPVFLTKFFGISELSVFVCYILGGILTSFVLLGVYMAMRKIMPKVMSIIVGGR